jgi:N-methylhydantoinase A
LLDARYAGQSYELTVPCPSTAADGFSQEVAGAFHGAHQQRFGHSDATQAVEVVNVRLKAVALGDKPAMAPRTLARDTSVEPLFRTQASFFSGRYADTPVYARESLTPGKRIQGPSVVVQMDATTVLPPGWVAAVDGWGNLVAEKG